MRTAVNLAGRGVERVTRGMVLAQPGAFRSGDAAVAWIEVLGGAPPLVEETLTVHLGTTERQAKVTPLGRREVAPGAAGAVLLRFDRPVATYAAQRLVLRRPGVHGRATVAGGSVIDPEPPRGKGAVSRAAAQVEALRGAPEQRLLAIVRESRANGVDRPSLDRRMPPGLGAAAIAELEQQGVVLRAGSEQRWIDAGLVQALADKVVALVTDHQKAAPLSPGLGEAAVTSQLPEPERPLVELAVSRAAAAGRLVREGALLALPGRGPAVDAQTRAQMDALLGIYHAAGLTPPSDDELPAKASIDRKRSQELLAALRRTGALIKSGSPFARC